MLELGLIYLMSFYAYFVLSLVGLGVFEEFFFIVVESRVSSLSFGAKSSALSIAISMALKKSKGKTVASSFKANQPEPDYNRERFSSRGEYEKVCRSFAIKVLTP